MAQWKTIFKKLLFPKLWVVLLGIPASAAALIFVFVKEYQSMWFAYPIYAFSAYTSTISCILLFRLYKYVRQNIDEIMNRVPLVRRYFRDITFNMHVSLYRSVVLNVLYAVMKFAFSVYYRSVWFGTLAVYYLLLAVVRFALLHHANRSTFGANMKSEWKRYRMCGGILLLINLALVGVVIMVTLENKGFEYTGYLIYIMAMYSFYSTISAVVSVFKYRKYNSPVISAAKVLQLATAMVSMLSLETAMLAQFGTSESDKLHNIMTGSTGGGVCAVILSIAVYMIFHSNKKLKAIAQEALS